MLLSDYVLILRRRAAFVVLGILFGLAGAIIATIQASTVYETSTQLIVSGSSSISATDEVSARQLAIERATSFSQIAGTGPAIRAAEAAAGVTSGVSSVSASANGSSPFINLIVRGSNPRAIAGTANAYASTLPGVLKKLDQAPDFSPAELSAIRPAAVNTKPYSPRPVRNALIGLVLGLLLGLAAAFGREALDPRLRDSDEVEALTNMSLLGVIPVEMRRQHTPAKTHPRSARAEGYRLVRTNLLFAEAVGTPSTVLITSASVGEGKTSLATNLAISCAIAGERVLLVDADLRKPKVHEYLEIESAQGLSEVLTGAARLSACMRPAVDGALTVLSAGHAPRNPSELLGSSRMADLIVHWSKTYDRVIIDSAPLLPVADTVQLSTMVSGVILVARIGDTTRDRLIRARNTLGKVNSAPILGVVANAAVPGRDKAYAYGAQYGYGYVEPPARRGLLRADDDAVSEAEFQAEVTPVLRSGVRRQPSTSRRAPADKSASGEPSQTEVKDRESKD